MTTEQQVLLVVAERPGVCPFCGHQPVVRYLESRTEIQWVVDQACDHLVTQGGQGCDPTFDQPRDWQGPDWPWQRGWPAGWYPDLERRW